MRVYIGSIEITVGGTRKRIIIGQRETKPDSPPFSATNALIYLVSYFPDAKIAVPLMR